MKAQPAIRDYFFRTSMRMAVVATLVACSGILLSGFWLLRAERAEEFSHAIRRAASVYQMTVYYTRLEPFYTRLEELGREAGFTLLCAYDANNHLVVAWQHGHVERHCPKLMMQSGSKTSLLAFRMAQPVLKDDTYIGMMYAEGELAQLRPWLVRGVVLLTGLLSLCWATCYWVNTRIGRLFATQLLAVQEQINCMKTNDIAFGPVSSQAMMQEIASVSTSLVALRAHLDATQVRKEELSLLKRWYLDVMTHLLGGMRRQLHADSPLLLPIHDYSLFVQIERADALPTATVFDLAQLLDTALVTAKRQHPTSKHVHLTVSLQAGVARQWMGQPEMLEALFRHLLLIGLNRTEEGLVCLRLSLLPQNKLQFLFEDEGNAIQQWQLIQWLAAADAPLTHSAADISWLLVSRLVRRLGGSLAGVSTEFGGLLLEGTIPLQPLREALLPTALPFCAIGPARPFVLVVERERHRISEMLEANYCSCFVVESHQEALDWAGVFPFSALFLNATLPDVKEAIVRRFYYLRDEGALASIPCFAVVANMASVDWLRYDVTPLLLPIPGERIATVCHALLAPDYEFYGAHDVSLRQDLSLEFQTSLPGMDDLLAQQVSEVATLISCPLAERQEIIRERVHGVKSAALNMGYYRLAGLMGQVEYALAMRSFAPQNWQLIALCLRMAFSDKNA